MARLTIVLTLKDRPTFTKRWMRFMNDHSCPYKILIADGGSDQQIEAHLLNPSNYPNLNYEYYRYPFDTSWSDFWSKHVDICRKVTSDYLLFADNDDFYLVDKIPQIINFLDSNPLYSGCRGSISQLFLLSSQGNTVNSPTSFSYRMELRQAKSIENSSFLERCESFFSEATRFDHWLNWYCILRTSQVISILESLMLHNSKNVVIREILFNLMLLSYGKIKVIDPLFYIRQSGSSQAAQSLVKTANTLETLLIDDAFHHFNQYFKKHHPLDQQSLVLLNKALARYIGIWCNSCTEEYQRQSMLKPFKTYIRTILSLNIHILKFSYYLYLRLTSRMTRGSTSLSLRLPLIDDYVIES